MNIFGCSNGNTKFVFSSQNPKIYFYIRFFLHLFIFFLISYFFEKNHFRMGKKSCQSVWKVPPSASPYVQNHPHPQWKSKSISGDCRYRPQDTGCDHPLRHHPVMVAFIGNWAVILFTVLGIHFLIISIVKHSNPCLIASDLSGFQFYLLPLCCVVIVAETTPKHPDMGCLVKAATTNKKGATNNGIEFRRSWLNFIS